jgi:hypothetical protein
MSGMSGKRIVVPEGMMRAAVEASPNSPGDYVLVILEAALRWLSENPMLPTREQQVELLRKLEPSANSVPATIAEIVAAWQRRMFLASDPDEAIKHLLNKGWASCESIDAAIREAYRRGRESK